MVQKKPGNIGKNLLEGNPLNDFRDIVEYLNKTAVADAMQINFRTLINRLDNLGGFTFENFAKLGENMDLSDAKTVEILLLAFKQYLKERKPGTKK